MGWFLVVFVWFGLSGSVSGLLFDNCIGRKRDVGGVMSRLRGFFFMAGFIWVFRASVWLWIGLVIGKAQSRDERRSRFKNSSRLMACASRDRREAGLWELELFQADVFGTRQREAGNREVFCCCD